SSFLLVQSPSISLIPSSVFETLTKGSFHSLYASNSLFDHPAPTPRKVLPFDMTSRVATILARIAGGRKGMGVTIVPRWIEFVLDAKWAIANHDSSFASTLPSARK